MFHKMNAINVNKENAKLLMTLNFIFISFHKILVETVSIQRYSSVFSHEIWANVRNGLQLRKNKIYIYYKVTCYW